MALPINIIKLAAFFIIFLIIFKNSQVETYRLNVPRLLLPIFNDFPVNYTLKVTEGGCYRWTTSRPDIIRLIPVDEDYDHSCSVEVIVQTVARDLTRKTVIILAEDISSGFILRCDVIVDVISTLDIVTTTRELFIEEAPEAFEVRAYDEQGNEFTTLAGIEFKWEIGNTDKLGTLVGSNLGNNVLKFMTFQESPYETPNSVAMLDPIGKTGSICLLEGAKTGTAVISVRLLYPEYKHVPSVEISLIVLANLIIIPSDVTIMQFDSFTYRIVQVHQGRLEDIHIPSSQYHFQAEDDDKLEINNAQASAYALTLGRTRVFLHDKNVHEEYGVVLPTANVRIANVSYITIAVLPHRSRSLILGYSHEIVVEMFDSRDHKFYIGKGVEVTMKISDEYFNKISTTQNGTHVTAIPTTIGTTTVEATLHGVINNQGKKIRIPELTAKAELVIHSAVKIQPRILALPWDPKVKTRYDVALKASGGDGSYNWHSRQPSIINVSQNGALKILNKGTAEITVSLVRNIHNRDTAKVHVLVPTKLQIIEYNMEAAIGQSIFLHIALFGELFDGNEMKEIPFNDCQDLSFDIDIPDGNFVLREDEIISPSSIACKTITIVSKNMGTSKVSVTYGKNLTDNITVSAYEPLIVVHPQNSATLLAVGSSRNIIFKGGPKPWLGKGAGYRKKITVSNENAIKVIEQESLADDITVIRVLCKALGQGNVTLSVSNLSPFSSCKQSEAIANIQVTCSKPLHISLQPEFRDDKKCPMVQESGKIIAHSDELLKIIVVVRDETKNQFENITSLDIDWTLNPSTGLYPEVSSGTIEETFYDYNVPLPRIHFQRISSKKYLQSFNLKAIVTGYRKNILSSYGITGEWPPFGIENDQGYLVTPLIEASVNVILVNDTKIYPSALKILKDPNSKYYLKVSQGSGYYELVLSDPEIAEVRYIESTRTISIVPKKSGLIKISLVDLCLVSKPAEAEIEVQQLANMGIETVNKIEKGKFVTANLRLYDTNGYLMMLPNLDALDIKVETNNGFVKIKRAPIEEQGNPPFDKVVYLIHGIEEGEAQIGFHSGQGVNRIQSDVVIVQVFPPLQILPKNLTTIVGSIYQISTIGGPMNTDIEFQTIDKTILDITRTGVSEGKNTGKTKIYAKAVGFDSQGRRVIFSQDNAEVNVILLEGIKIIAPTQQIKVGAQIPLWAFGIPDHLTPLIIGSMKSPLTYTWTSSNPEIFSLHNMYEGTGINIRYQNAVTLRGWAKKSGIVTVNLTATTPCNVIGGCRIQPHFSSFIKIEVFEELRLINQDAPNGSMIILMAPNSSLKLKTNRDKLGLTSYKILTESMSDIEESFSLSPTGVITVSKNGLLRSGENYGTTILSITNVESYSAKQTLNIVVQVKPIHYMMLLLDSGIRIRPGEELTSLPKGLELNYVLKFYDNVGSVFHAADIDYKILSSRADLATFSPSKNNVTAKFLENGDGMIKFFSDKSSNTLFDYVHMNIADVLYPIKAHVTVGDVICFSMPLLSLDGESGYWQSASPELVSVDPLSGVGIARASGQAKIKHSISTHLRDEVEVEVDPIVKITMVPISENNITGTQIFSAPLILKGKSDIIKENNIISRGFGGCRLSTTFSLNHYPFTCIIQFTPVSLNIAIKELFIVKPRFDISSGFYYCDIIPTGSPSAMGSTIETKIKINALSREVEGSPVEVYYVPPMYIPSREIYFISSTADELPIAVFDIYGQPRVLEHIAVEVPEEISITSHHYLSKNRLQYKLCLMQSQDITGRKIIVVNDLTKQNVSLIIRIPRYDSFPRISGIQWIDYLYFHRYTLGTFVILVISFYHFWRNKMNNMDLTIKNKYVFAEKLSPNTSKKTAPATPSTSMNASNSSSAGGSPGSPLRPFSAFEPVYGDPRGLYTPNARRNRTCL